MLMILPTLVILRMLDGITSHIDIGKQVEKSTKMEDWRQHFGYVDVPT